ncbi:MAG: 50S ribosomal protein L32 [Nitrospirota bacterium]|nr:50S ribosomal protein L32 [Nitrospirota bacterium]
MAHPKRKTSKSVARKRRTHKKLTVPGLVNCPNCSEPTRPHNACPSCGQYKGREVVEASAI